MKEKEEVEFMTPSVISEIKSGQASEQSIFKEAPKNATELRKQIGVKSAFGKTLIDLIRKVNKCRR
jgi:hypothetical protein